MIRIAGFLAVGLLSACATIPVDEREPLRQEINAVGDETIAALVDKNPALQASIDASAGYFVGRISGAKVPVVGGGSGLGVLYDKENQARTYMNVTRSDVGVGLGAGRYRVLVLLQNREILEQFRSGVWKSTVGAETAAGTAGSAAVVAGEGLKVYAIGEAGAAATTTARLIRLSVNTDLTDVGVAAVSIPNKGFVGPDRQGEDAPRKWNRALPFLAQKVIDQGYDLPLPYGVGLTYVNVDQEQELTNLEVGINGRDKEPFPFVGFENAFSRSDSAQLKLDAWLLPFMNIFAMVGKVDGNAPLDVILDGNGMLDQLGVTCPPPAGPPPPPPTNTALCNLLEDQTITLPVDAKFNGTTYGIGTVLAGGWNGWFVTVPISFTYADMDGKETEGISITFTPRVGRLVNLRRWGNIAPYVGVNYLNTELQVAGTVVTPDGLLEIDYTIDQENKDKWNALLGANWNINKRWSWSVEYDGFVGSRDTFITSVSFRY